MRGRAFIDRLRRMAETARLSGEVAISEEYALEADAVEEADGSFRSLIESECILDGGWWETRTDDDEPTIARALSYLDRRGLIERKPGEPHLIRFVEET